VTKKTFKIRGETDTLLSRPREIFKCPTAFDCHGKQDAEVG